MLNAELLKKDFPIFNRQINNKPIVYLDNSATSQKPLQVIETLTNFYSNYNANIHRGAYTLSEEATDLYEEARKKVAAFIGAARTSEVIFTSGTTEAINFIASSFGTMVVNEGDVILVSEAEHHSNLVTWQMLAKAKNATLEFIKVDDQGYLDINDFKSKLSSKVKLIALFHVSNVLGTIVPLKEICKIAKENNIPVVVDGAQAVPHLRVNVNSLGCDFYTFSGHKMLGPTGVGVLWAKSEILADLQPFKFGGGMILSVTKEKSEWAETPERFEAGTPSIADVIALGAAVDYLQNIGLENIHEHELMLTGYALTELQKVPGLKIIGPTTLKDRSGLIAFTIHGLHAHDIASVLNTQNVCVRSGHHCAMPLHIRFDVSATVRASFYLYNTKSDIDVLVNGLHEAIKILG